ncbi:MAG: energy-coupling factor ABC transporter substrate-binding protein [Tissierellia bacterium]|nr:energy-coupling factor ABC transporter substrate-binding protein [Tissierellia bacterium]
MKKSTRIILFILLLLMIVVPLYMLKDAEFGGADDAAEDQIGDSNPEYEPWFEPLFEPKSGEIESLLFSAQAAIGAIIIGYYLGYNKGKKNA